MFCRIKRKLAAITLVAFACCMAAGCFHSAERQREGQNEVGPVPSARTALSSMGLPEDFFRRDMHPDCAREIISYRFLVWLDSKTLAIGFSTSPVCRVAPDQPVKGMLRILVFSSDAKFHTARDIPYLADGNGEIVADGEAAPGPNNTLLLRLQSVNLDPQGRTESKSTVLLLDRDLKEVGRIERFLDEITFVNHDLVFHTGSFLGPQTYSILGGPALEPVAHREVSWPTGTRDSKFGEHGFAFMLCSQELSPGEYRATSGVVAGAKQRCTMNALDEQGNSWSAGLQDDEVAEIVGLLSDSEIAAIIRGRGPEKLVVWKKGNGPSPLPWLPKNFDGRVDSSTPDLSRYASLATNDDSSCNVLMKVLSIPCGGNAGGRFFVFDSKSSTPLVDRGLSEYAKAALAPDGMHYASFESSELRIYPLSPMH